MEDDWCCDIVGYVPDYQGSGRVRSQLSKGLFEDVSMNDTNVGPLITNRFEFLY